ncbi:MAG: IS66 family insertion sequence element accessory protein TnpB [Prevotella sp.]|nr:IS66 family insertion sequence element accessory protein TnpB [Prevotella sp.]
MFSLTGATRFKYIPNYKDMRGGYDKLCGVVRTLTGKMEEGTAYVFTSKDQKLVKIIRHENNECQLYVQRFDGNMSFIRLEFDGLQPIYVLEYKYLVAMLECPVFKKIGPIKRGYEEEAA